MVLEEKKVKNICNFYVSEYHLEIMLLPYISKKIDNEENITIITEIDLESTLNVVIERINLDKDKKEKIKKIGWNIQNIENIIPNTNVILIGSKKFINEKVFELKERQVENLEIIACYNYNEVKKIGWNIQNIENIIPNTNVILIGSKKFINEKVFELKERQVENLEIIACYNYNEVKNDMKEIVSKYDGMLNTLGINKI